MIRSEDFSLGIMGGSTKTGAQRTDQTKSLLELTLTIRDPSFCLACTAYGKLKVFVMFVFLLLEY